MTAHGSPDGGRREALVSRGELPRLPHPPRRTHGPRPPRGRCGAQPRRCRIDVITGATSRTRIRTTGTAAPHPALTGESHTDATRVALLVWGFAAERYLWSRLSPGSLVSRAGRGGGAAGTVALCHCDGCNRRVGTSRRLRGLGPGAALRGGRGLLGRPGLLGLVLLAGIGGRGHSRPRAPAASLDKSRTHATRMSLPWLANGAGQARRPVANRAA